MFRHHDTLVLGDGWYPIQREGGSFQLGDRVWWPYAGGVAEGVVRRQSRLGSPNDYCDVSLERMVDGTLPSFAHAGMMVHVSTVLLSLKS